MSHRKFEFSVPDPFPKSGKDKIDTFIHVIILFKKYPEIYTYLSSNEDLCFIF